MLTKSFELGKSIYQWWYSIIPWEHRIRMSNNGWMNNNLSNRFNGLGNDEIVSSELRHIIW